LGERNDDLEIFLLGQSGIYEANRDCQVGLHVPAAIHPLPFIMNEPLLDAPETLPAIFFGRDNSVTENVDIEAWRWLGVEIPTPRAILSVSAHRFVPGTGVTTRSVLGRVCPDADIPVVQLSIDETQPASFHFEAGRKLATAGREYLDCW
jgi:aromatic ring-opening dioxygenase catalytic subunit (LigB family)